MLKRTPDLSNFTPDTSRFPEYEWFEPEDKAGMVDRVEQNIQFQQGRIANPSREYPLLVEEHMILQGEALKDAIDIESDETEKAKLIARQKGVEIALASTKLADAQTHTDRWINGREVTEASERKYGEVNVELFWPLLQKAAETVNQFKATGVHANLLKEQLTSLLPEVPEGVEPVEQVDFELLEDIRDEVVELMEPITREIPSTGDYTAEEIAEIVKRALANKGLDREGWLPVINPKTDLFSTKRVKKQCVIPNPPQEDGEAYTRSAEDLFRILPHEIGIHANVKPRLGEDFEEGLAILVECVMTNSTDGAAMARAEKRYLNVGLASGIDGKQRNARQVFEITWRLEAIKLSKDGTITTGIEAKAKKTAQAHIDNIFRGTDYKLPGVLYNKAKVYYEGISQAAEYAKSRRHTRGWLNKLLEEGKDI